MTPILATMSIAALYRIAADLLREPLTTTTCAVSLLWGACLGCFLDLATGY